MKKLPRWVLVLIGVGIVVVFLGIGAIVAITAWVQQNVHVETVSGGKAEAEFDKVRQRFAGRAPLLELKDGVPQYVTARTAEGTTDRKLDTMHVLVWDPRDGELARFALPFWLLRMKSEPIRFSAYAGGFDDRGVELRPEDIEKYGPGIVIDATLERGERFLFWAE